MMMSITSESQNSWGWAFYNTWSTTSCKTIYWNSDGVFPIKINNCYHYHSNADTYQSSPIKKASWQW